MAGVVDTSPGWATWVGGCLVLGATCLVTVATARREARQEAKGQAVVQLEQVCTRACVFHRSAPSVIAPA